MKTIQEKKRIRSQKRSFRVRKHLRGTTLKPRLSVNKTNCHIDIQLIDDEKGITVASTSTRAKEFRTSEFSKKNKASARKLGEKIAELAQQQNVKEVVFDRGSHKYHGILSEVADGARGSGLKF